MFKNNKGHNMRKMDNLEFRILQLLRKNPFLAQQEIADVIGISRSSVAGHILNLQKKGHIRGKGYIFSSGNYAVTVGASNMDITSFASTELLKKDSNPGKTKYTLGGVARNVAHNIAALKNDSYLISVIAPSPICNSSAAPIVRRLILFLLTENIYPMERSKTIPTILRKISIYFSFPRLANLECDFLWRSVVNFYSVLCMRIVCLMAIFIPFSGIEKIRRELYRFL